MVVVCLGWVCGDLWFLVGRLNLGIGGVGCLWVVSWSRGGGCMLEFWWCDLSIWWFGYFGLVVVVLVYLVWLCWFAGWRFWFGYAGWEFVL